MRLLLASSTAAVLFAGVTNVGEVMLARDVLGTSASGLAALVAAHGARHDPRLARRALQELVGVAPRVHRRALLHGRSTCCCARSCPNLWLLLPVFVLGGFGNGFALVHDRLLLGAAVPDALHGRVFALQKALTSLAFAASFIGASVLISVGGVQTTFALAGAGMLGVIAISSPRMRAAWPAPSAPVPPLPMWLDPDLYDVENADDPAFDLGYWESVVRDVAPRRMLELACGTGRLTLPLARLGVAEELVALDSSAPFVGRLRERLAEEPEAVRNAVHVVEGDMRGSGGGRPVRPRSPSRSTRSRI